MYRSLIARSAPNGWIGCPGCSSVCSAVAVCLGYLPAGIRGGAAGNFALLADRTAEFQRVL